MAMAELHQSNCSALQMALLAPSETGKSALLEHLALASMPPEKEYNEQEALSNPDQLEAMRLARLVSGGDRTYCMQIV